VSSDIKEKSSHSRAAGSTREKNSGGMGRKLDGKLLGMRERATVLDKTRKNRERVKEERNAFIGGGRPKMTVRRKGAVKVERH